MRKRLRILFFLFSTLASVHAQSPGVSHPAVDKLGRRLPTHQEVGDIRPGKTVAMFYWTWHVRHSAHNGVDLSKVLKANPEMQKDWDHPLWAQFTSEPGKDRTGYFWGAPLFDFTDGRDKWVIRKQLEMLGDAGVDVLFYDCTNVSYTWKEGYEAVAQVMAEARADGVKVPQFAFMLNLGHDQESTAIAIEELYDDMFRIGKYRESWFLWEGKPVVMAYPEMVDKHIKDSAKARAIRNFFTFRPGRVNTTSDPPGKTIGAGWNSILSMGLGKRRGDVTSWSP